MRTRPLTLGLTALAVLALSACGAAFDGPPGERGTEARDVTGARGIVLDGYGRLNIATGDEASLTITAGENVRADITSEVREGILYLDLDRRGWANTGDITYNLKLPEVTEITVKGAGDVNAALTPTSSLDLRVQGAGDVEVRSIDVEDLIVEVEGAGSVHVEGTAARQVVGIDGAGDYRAAELRSSTAEVVIAGVGGADVYVTDVLDAAVRGAGSITYDGGAQVTREVSGVGEISQR